MPETYGIGRGGSKPGERLGWETIDSWLTASRNYWVNSTRADGRPHAQPVWGLWLEGSLLFSTSADSLTGRNLHRDPRAAIHLESGDEVTILEGEVQPVTDPVLLEKFADAYEVKYDLRPGTDDPESPVLGMRPITALAWAEADFPETATRWRF
jgi:hypothetical protein